MSSIITRAGCCLNGKEQPLYNRKTKSKVIVSPNYWELKDKTFDALSSQLIPVSSSDHIIKDLSPISDQGSIGSCVANAWCDALEILMGIEGIVVQLSRLFTYWISRDLVGSQHADAGCYIRAGAQQLATIGVVVEKYWPYDVSKIFVSPTTDLYTMASNNRINSFYRIISIGNNKVVDIEKAIRANHPVVFGTMVGDELMNYSGGNIALEYPKKPLGNHAMIIVGIRLVRGKREFLIRNSWSASWGNGGYFWMNEDWIKNPNTDDIWVPTRMKLI
jgi:C1A family cysteine protease